MSVEQRSSHILLTMKYRQFIRETTTHVLESGLDHAPGLCIARHYGEISEGALQLSEDCAGFGWKHKSKEGDTQCQQKNQ